MLTVSNCLSVCMHIHGAHTWCCYSVRIYPTLCCGSMTGRYAGLLLMYCHYWLACYGNCPSTREYMSIRYSCISGRPERSISDSLSWVSSLSPHYTTLLLLRCDQPHPALCDSGHAQLESLLGGRQDQSLSEILPYFLRIADWPWTIPIFVATSLCLTLHAHWLFFYPACSMASPLTGQYGTGQNSKTQLEPAIFAKPMHLHCREWSSPRLSRLSLATTHANTSRWVTL
ncbi:hypothetical protein QBC33DRAFT_54551 [Phialemonium atrogriseum]|uniref:Uncharacterized protein n=1 Tax=Phialemonium atrogriseum TaxID=1093897 RepID=A0AAJ0C038_9PEZI|nr:uncharacterized protein QBC33DRAFT_54551 [Phialemonium atrogriseum]KAK1767690.1 hypothetical protein QBC33DRAFT_54551 [Phialemonium atrogriseum]